MTDPRKILVPTDFSDHSLAALRHARGLAEVFGAELIVTYVVPEPLYPFALSTSSLPELEKQYRVGVSERLKELVEDETGGKARPILRSGRPFLEILETANEEGVDLVVMATHGYSGLEHAMMGSVAEKVLRKATCPVLVVPPAVD